VRWLVLFTACSGSTLTLGNDGGASDLGGAHDLAVRAGAPVNHRADDSACAGTPPPGTCTLMGNFAECNTDSQCTAGANGRCIESMGGALTCRCSYDTCNGDSQCPMGQTCGCHGTAFNNGGNTCIAGNCRVDADCPGSWCSPSAAANGCGATLGGYYCHTAMDLCTNDADCPTQNGPMFCEFSISHQRWECAQELLCP
jgi:hypothetical protein